MTAPVPALKPDEALRADPTTADRPVAETLADASKAGLAKVGFISKPERP